MVFEHDLAALGRLDMLCELLRYEIRHHHAQQLRRVLLLLQLHAILDKNHGRHRDGDDDHEQHEEEPRCIRRQPPIRRQIINDLN